MDRLRLPFALPRQPRANAGSRWQRWSSHGWKEKAKFMGREALKMPPWTPSTL